MRLQSGGVLPARSLGVAPHRGRLLGAIGGPKRPVKPLRNVISEPLSFSDMFCYNRAASGAFIEGRPISERVFLHGDQVSLSEMR
jgi:hypothetical protein